MHLSAGDKLGPYQIVGLIGKGGMGEVYRGTDTRLGRPVAIKVSAREFNDRFEREARAISALNHPNICTLYDVGPNYLVMELVEGESLAAMIGHGPLPVEQALQYAVQIADALAAAHAKGVIHRDLKPGNILITRNGAKVLDFGLAKLSSERQPSGSTDLLETVTEPITRTGSILGTLYYMAPEQVEGKEADERSDIFSFGVVFYEMITGQRPFNGDTQAAVLASLLKDQPPPMSQHPPATQRTGERLIPRPLERLVRKCLEKKPDDRWQSARDLKPALELIDLDAPPPSTTSSTPVPVQVPRRKWLWPSVAAGIVLVASAAGYQWWQTHRFTDLPIIRHDVDLGQDLVFMPPVTFVTNFAISPDATRIAFIARPKSGGPPRLYTRRLDQAAAVELPGTESPRGPFYSPDGKWLGFAAGRKLYKISVEGGAAVSLLELTGAFAGAAWGEGFIVVAQLGTPLLRIADNGSGKPESLGGYKPGEVIQVSPRLLPSGETVIFSSANEGPTDPDRGSIEAISLADHERTTILKGAAAPRYVASRGGAGHLLYTFKDAIYAMPFDPSKLEALGPAVPVLNDVQTTGNTRGKYDVSALGTLIYQKFTGEQAAPDTSTLQWVDAGGKSEPLRLKPGRYDDLRISPDGKRIALAIQEGTNLDIAIYDWQNDRTTSLTFKSEPYSLPVWTPDGQFVVFASSFGGLYWTRSDGSGQPKKLLEGSVTDLQVPWSFSPDGKRLAFEKRTSGRFQLWTVPVQEQGGQLTVGTPEQYLKSATIDSMPQFSPDGKWVAYRSIVSGQPQIFVRPSSGQRGQWLVSSQGGNLPMWSRAGQDLFYMSEAGAMAVHYSTQGDTFIADKPRLWQASVPGQVFDLSPDGKRLLVLAPERQSTAPRDEHEIVFLQNFFDELRRRAPVGK